MNRDVTVRPYRLPEDFEALVRVYEASEDHHDATEPEPRLVPRDVEQTRRRFRRIDPADPDRAMLAAEADGEIVGLIEASIRREPDVGFIGVWVDQVSVLAEWRGKGIGTRLMHEVEAWAISRGAMSIALDTWLSNAGARRLYQRLGYAERAVVMGKRLPAGGASAE